MDIHPSGPKWEPAESLRVAIAVKFYTETHVCLFSVSPGNIAYFTVSGNPWIHPGHDAPKFQKAI